MRTNAVGLVLCGLFGVASSAFAGEWFADASRPVGTGDGKSERTAFHTIQEAVDAAADGDVVTVLPGVYDEGGYVDGGGYTNRVAILGKKLTLRSKNLDRDNTVILGAYDANGCHLDKDTSKKHYDYMGPAAVRCILLDSTARGSRIEGFAIRRGAAHEVASGDNSYTTGGGVYVSGARRDVYIADCLFQDCVSSRGGALRYGTAIRCHFDRNVAFYGNGCVARESNLYNCLCTRNGYNGTGSAQLEGCKLVNCTLSQNMSGAVLKQCVVVNTLECHNAYPTGTTDPNVATNCLVASLKHSTGYDYFSASSLNLSTVGATDDSFIAPARGDFRLRAGAPAATYGDGGCVDALFSVPEADRGIDFVGKPIPTSGAIAVGCHQTAVVPAGGAWRFVNRAIVDGWETGVADVWCYATTTAQCYRVQCVCKDGEYPFAYSTDIDMRYPQPDGSIWVMTPPVEYGSITINPWVATNVLWVAKDGKDTNDGRMRQTAFKTIQRAINAAPTLPDAMPTDLMYRTIIRVKEGVYGPEDGTTVHNDQANTLYVDHKRLLVIGEDGPEKCVVTGAPDTTVAADDYGCGSKAVRCISAAKSAFAFQRFTFRDGHTVSYKSSGYGGLMRGYGVSDSQILDSVVTNCVGNRGAVLFVGSMERCAVRDCRDYYCCLRSSTARNCLFETVDVPVSDAIIGQDASAYGCTFVARGAANGKLFRSDSKIVWNSVAYRGITVAANTHGCVLDAFSPTPAASAKYLVADARFVDVADGDYRLLPDSPAIGGGATTNEYWKYVGGDMNGKTPLVVNGRPTAGAFQAVATAKLTVNAPSEGSVSPAGTTVLEPGESVTVTYTRDVRNILGYLVNGETQAVESTSWTYTAPAFTPGMGIGLLDVSVLYSPHWYVSPTGDDGNDGWTADTPFQKLCYAMTVATNEGDVVHALAGHYTEGSEAVPGSKSNMFARVVVPKKVTLVADAGPSMTFIHGAKDSGSTKYDGCGPEALKGVYLQSQAKLSGFTVCGGRTAGGSADDVDCSGGGVYCATSGNSAYSEIVENCILSNNYARSGAATYRGRIVGCQILENHGYSSNPAGRYSCLYNCYIDRNWGGTTYQIYYQLENCTFGPDNLNGSGSRSTSFVVCGQPQNGAVAKNCVFMDRIDKSATTAVVATNSVFRNDDASYFPEEANRYGCDLMSVADMKMMPGTCVPAADSPLTDKADETLMSDFAKSMDASCVPGGGARVSNGCADIGAFEHDWRPEYATMLGAGVVSAASPKVVGALGQSSVTIESGSLDVTLTGGSTTRKNRLTVPFSVVGDGALSVFLNGALLGEYTKADGPQTLRFKSALAENNLVFDYDGDDAGAVVSRLEQVVPGILFVVR